MALEEYCAHNSSETSKKKKNTIEEEEEEEERGHSPDVNSIRLGIKLQDIMFGSN